jgi:hypothetical protein
VRLTHLLLLQLKMGRIRPVTAALLVSVGSIPAATGQPDPRQREAQSTLLDEVRCHSSGRRVMATKRRSPFDPKWFLAKIGDGRTISKYRGNEVVFTQGDLANAVFYIQRGKV